MTVLSAQKCRLLLNKFQNTKTGNNYVNIDFSEKTIGKSVDDFVKIRKLQQDDVRNSVACLQRIGANIETEPKPKKITGRMRVEILLSYIKKLCASSQPEPIVLTPDQNTVMWQFIRTVMPFLFQDDFDSDGMKYMSEHFWDEILPFLLWLAYRQVGKTTLVVIFAAAMLLTVENLAQNIFATGMRISEMIIARILRLLMSCEEVTQNFSIQHSVKRIRIEVSPTDTRMISSFPGKGETTRGTDGRGLHYLDEADYVDPNFVINTLLPMCADKKSALIATTTVKNKDAQASKLAELKDAKGKSVVNVIRSYAVCAKCASEGKASSCRHKITEIPEFKDQGRLDIIRKALSANEASFAKEMGGILLASDNLSFLSSKIDKLFDQKPFVPDIYCAPRNVFVMIDPNGGGSDQFALLCLYRDERTGCIVVREKKRIFYFIIFLLFLKKRSKDGGGNKGIVIAGVHMNMATDFTRNSSVDVIIPNLKSSKSSCNIGLFKKAAILEEFRNRFG